MPPCSSERPLGLGAWAFYYFLLVPLKGITKVPLKGSIRVL